MKSYVGGAKSKILYQTNAVRHACPSVYIFCAAFLLEGASFVWLGKCRCICLVDNTGWLGGCLLLVDNVLQCPRGRLCNKVIDAYRRTVLLWGNFMLLKRRHHQLLNLPFNVRRSANNSSTTTFLLIKLGKTGFSSLTGAAFAAGFRHFALKVVVDWFVVNLPWQKRFGL